MTKILAPTLLLFVLTLPLAVQAVSTTDKRPGDDFRQAAAEYTQLAAQSRRHSDTATGEDSASYQQLTRIYRELANIKRHAAGLADQGNWDDISWNRYEQLSLERDQIVDTLKRRDRAQSDNGFIATAKKYEREAAAASKQANKHQGSERSLYKQLAGLFAEMARIKRDAALAASKGLDFDWTRYGNISQRKNEIAALLKLLAKARKLGNA